MKNSNLILLITTFGILTAECSDLNEADCLYWSEYCEWDENIGQCQENGGGGIGEEYGPYEFQTITEADGLRNGPDYQDGILYFPLDLNGPLKSIVITPGWGGGSSSMAAWGMFFASYGFVAMTIGPNDEINDSHQMRAEGLLDGIITVQNENDRINSPLYGLIDLDNFSVCGYSMGGGAAQIAAVLDNSITSVISFNPTVIFEDCNLCPGYDYCICLVPEMLNHPVPTIIFAGEVEVDELPSYDGLLGQDHYLNMSETTDKILFEGAGEGHGFAAYPNDEVSEYVLSWINYYISDNSLACEELLEEPESASQYITNITCGNIISGDVNNDGLVNVIDIITIVNLILTSEFQTNADLNNDQQINVLDVVSVINIILG